MAKKKAMMTGEEMDKALDTLIEEGTMGPISSEKPKIDHIAVDFPNEALNNLARKMNQIIDCVNG